MKNAVKFLCLLMALLLSFAWVGCGKTENPTPDAGAGGEQGTGEAPAGGESAKGDKVLVVWYSATGSTARIAGYIAGALNADTFELQPQTPYSSADLNWNDADSRVSREHRDTSLRQVPLTAVTAENWGGYDTVFLGYPIWWGEAAWVVNGFVQANDFTGKTVVPFCTSASSGMGNSGQALAAMSGTGNWLSGKRFSGSDAEKTVADWAKGLFAGA